MAGDVRSVRGRTVPETVRRPLSILILRLAAWHWALWIEPVVAYRDIRSYTCRRRRMRSLASSLHPAELFSSAGSPALQRTLCVHISLAICKFPLPEPASVLPGFQFVTQMKFQSRVLSRRAPSPSLPFRQRNQTEPQLPTTRLLFSLQKRLHALFQSRRAQHIFSL